MARTVQFTNPSLNAINAGDGTTIRSNDRQRALADALRTRSLQDIPSNGGNIAWTQGLAKLAEALVARHMTQKADASDWDIAARADAERRGRHFGDGAPVDLSQNPFRSAKSNRKLADALLQRSQVASAPPGSIAGDPSTGPLQQSSIPAHGAPEPVAPAPNGIPPRQGVAPALPQSQMDRFLPNMPAEAGMQFETADPNAYWAAVNKQYQPTDGERYAQSFGDPGSNEYNSALQDYILKTYGPTASGYRGDMEDQRFQGRSQIENQRQDNRVGLEHVRQDNRVQLNRERIGGQAAIHAQPNYRDLHPQPRSGRGRAASTGGQTATDPKTGKKVQWDGSAWVPVG